ncbi:VacJ family lipoprotein [Mannheimia sp. AT1]|uniref:VacJ family lipoprotein n=1 Tax=Mannheimia cairinae TaxID=3025936 RepID=A0ABT5MS73_9PAST|nr:VacJ family lipoprotein [Mannheimia cairinae]MDD0825033.1 VacJ family lipoprotein [Mannheimia cairinae]MDD0827271.1 VacJ family lipoprotein [Mannheimia cairinae]
MKLASLKQLCVVFSVAVLTACSSSINPETGVRDDPLEGFNRAMWKVNYDYLDPYVLKPVAKGWKDYVPSPIKTGLINVANNLDEPVSFVNRLIEGEGQKAMVHFNRFWINTVFGLGGLIDWASQDEGLRLTNGQRGLGESLGANGVASGAYIMVPAYGATTPRQAIGSGVETGYSVLTYVGTPWSIAKFVVQGVDSRSKLLDQDALLQQAQDPYVTFREAYFQNLEFKVKDGNVETSQQELLSEEELKDID